ncbi:PqqD family peptide modification chaperone [Methylocystis sp. IM3]|uniref:PqqD family peptide modification chaperone n=1 Tax=unclassified Methylocystis TaxID=2625913 RepID=UPI003119B3E6
MLRADLGSARVLARPGDRRLWVLDAVSGALWDAQAAGVAPAAIADALARRFGMEIEAAGRHLDRLRDSWRGAGLLDAAVAAARDDVFPPPPAFPAPGAAPPQPHSLRLALRLDIAGQAIVADIEDPELRALCAPLLAPLGATGRRAGADAPVADRVILAGDPMRWRLTVNGAEMERFPPAREPVRGSNGLSTGSPGAPDAGAGRDAAVVALMTTLAELGCRTRDRLLVVHGAGLLSPQGAGLLLVAPGGSGKTTLAMALEAEGFRLLSDDVVPIRADGAALGLGLPACVKRGAWGALAGRRPDVAQAPEVFRFGQAVRLLTPRNPPFTGAVAPGVLLFPAYRPGAAPSSSSLTPEQALRGLVEAEAVIRDLTQSRLDALCRWISSMPAFSLAYPDLDAGLSLVRRALAAPAASP